MVDWESVSDAVGFEVVAPLLAYFESLYQVDLEDRTLPRMSVMFRDLSRFN